MRIKLRIGVIEIYASLDATPTSLSLAEALPCSSSVNTWGEEVYFGVPVHASLEENATDVVEPGTVCFWTQGSSIAIPYGPTPVSRGDECRLVTQVNLLGSLEGDARVLSQVKDGDPVTVEMA
jgi:hypothetical protein